MDYFKRIELLSSSQIKGLIKKGEDSKDEYRTQFILGSIVDLHLTEGKHLDDIRIVDINVIVPKPQMKTFVDCLYRLYRYDYRMSDQAPEIKEYYFREAFDTANFKTKSYEKVLEDFYEESCQGYWFHMLNRESSAKYLILPFEEAQVQNCIVQMNNSKYLQYFKKSETSFPQLEIYTKYYKIKLDGLIFDPVTKILQPVDLKTLGTFAENFSYNILSFRYDIQAYYYCYVLSLIIDGEDFTCNDPDFEKLIKSDEQIQLSETFDFVFVSKNFNTQVLKVKYVVEEEKEILGKMLYTEKDVQKAIEIHKFCRDKNIDISLTNYYLYNDSSVTI